MSLPTTITCTRCGATIVVDRTEYRGLQQPDPTQAGYYAYVVSAACTTCTIRVVTLHPEATPQ